MRLSPEQPMDSVVTTLRTEAGAKAQNATVRPTSADGWRWAVIHFPCLEHVTPRGEIVMISDKRHIREARRKFSDQVVWHEKELALFSEHMDQSGLDLQMFVTVNKLKLRTRGWFLGVEGKEATVSGHAAKA